MTNATTKQRVLNSVHFRTHMTPEMHHAIRLRALKLGVSMSEWVKGAIAARLEREG